MLFFYCILGITLCENLLHCKLLQCLLLISKRHVTMFFNDLTMYSTVPIVQKKSDLQIKATSLNFKIMIVDGSSHVHEFVNFVFLVGILRYRSVRDIFHTKINLSRALFVVK